MLENNKGPGSEDELFTLEATPSKPESINIQQGYKNVTSCVDKKRPLWMDVAIVLFVFLILIIYGLSEAVNGTCPNYPRKTAAFCQIGQLILGKLSLINIHRFVNSVD